MTTSAVQRLFAALGAPGVDVRFVGGCVRNAVMGIPVGEIDVATPETPDQVMTRLAAAGVKVVPTGLDHGTVTAVLDGATFEITSLRRDTACDGRHAAVEFTADWAEDARRRDFTFNAMSLRGDGTLFDYHGGVSDAEAGRVRFVGVAADRIQEDYLRILRLFRFFAAYGRGAIEAQTLAAVRAHAAGLDHLSAERVSRELIKILGAPDPRAAVAAMDECGVWARLLPEVRDRTVLDRLPAIEEKANESADWRLRLASGLAADAAASVAARLKFSTADCDHLLRLTAAKPAFAATTPGTVLRQALYHDGASIVRGRLVLAWARSAPDVAQDAAWTALLREARAWQPVALPVSGRDVLALGVAAGPAVGALLAEVEAWWLERDFEPDRAAVLAILKDLVSPKR